MERSYSSRLSIWHPLGIGALGIALCLAGIYIGLFFVLLGFITLWFYFHQPKERPHPQESFTPREIETPLTRLRQAQVPTKYQTGLIDSRCFYSKTGIEGDQPAWLHADENGDNRHMCGRCRDSLIVEKRRKSSF